MQGQILAAHGPDDGPWIVRRLVNSGALTERQGKAFIRRLTRGIPFEELILGHVPDSLLTTLLAGRFRQNLLDFLASPPPIDFHPMDTLFVPNVQSGHDTRTVLASVIALRERVSPLMRHRGPLTLRLGPAMPSSRNEARLVDLCDPPISMRDLLTYSPFETGETLDHVMNMLSNGALVSDEGIRLQRTRRREPTSDYAVEELFSLEGPTEATSTGVPADPIAPEHLALLREESQHPGHDEFGQVPVAFSAPIAPEELPHLASSHLVLVESKQDLAPSSGTPATSSDSVVPVLVTPLPSVDETPAGASTQDSLPPSEPVQTVAVSADDKQLATATVLEEEEALAFAPPEDHHPEPPPEPVVQTAPAAPDPTPTTGPAKSQSLPTGNSMPESWRDLSALGFNAPPDTPKAAAAPPSPDASPPAGSTPESLSRASERAPATPRAIDPPNAPTFAKKSSKPVPSAPLPEPAPKAAPRAALDPADLPVLRPASTAPTRSAEPNSTIAPSPATQPAATASPTPPPVSESPFTDLELDPPSLPPLARPTPPEVTASPAVTAPLEATAKSDTAAPAEPPDDEPQGETDLLDAARRYLEEAQVRRKEQNKKPLVRERDPEPIATSSGKKKFTGFDFDVDESELAMFADHDRYRGGGQGQFTLGKKLLDKVELLPEPRRTAKPDRIRLSEPDLPEEDSIIEMGEATAEEEAEAGVVALAFSAPTLDSDQVLYKISVAGDVALAVSRQYDAHVGPGGGQTTIQLLVAAAAGSFARLFQGVQIRRDGSLDEDKIFSNLQQRPQGEQRSLLDRGLKDFIERALATAAEELPGASMDTLLNDIAGYQQRLRS